MISNTRTFINAQNRWKKYQMNTQWSQTLVTSIMRQKHFGLQGLCLYTYTIGSHFLNLLVRRHEYYLLSASCLSCMNINNWGFFTNFIFHYFVFWLKHFFLFNFCRYELNGGIYSCSSQLFVINTDNSFVRLCSTAFLNTVPFYFAKGNIQ